MARELNEANHAKKLSGGAPGGKPRRTNPSHAHLTCHSGHKLGHISPNCPEKQVLLAAQVLAAQVLPTPYAPVGTSNAAGAQLLSNAMSEEEACLVAQNILNSLDSSPPDPSSSPHAYASAPAHCGVANLTNIAPLSPQVLAALVSQLRTGSKSLLIWSVEVCSTEVSFEAMLIRSVEAFSTEVSFEAKPRVDDKPAYAESMSDTRELSHRDLGDIVVNLRNQSKNDDQASVSDESDYESDDTDQVLTRSHG